MKKCPNCGKITDSKFCPDCGTSLINVNEVDALIIEPENQGSDNGPEESYNEEGIPKEGLFIETNEIIVGDKSIEGDKDSQPEKNMETGIVESIDITEDSATNEFAESVDSTEDLPKTESDEIKEKANVADKRPAFSVTQAVKSKKAVAAIAGVAIAAICIIILVSGSGKRFLTSQVSTESLTTTVIHSLKLARPKEWKNEVYSDSEKFVCLKNEKWKAEELVKYEGDSADDAKIENYFSSYVNDVIEKGELSAKGLKGEYIITDKKITSYSKPVNTYLAVFKADRSIFSFSYSAYASDFDKRQAEMLMSLIDVESYSTSGTYKVSYYQEDFIEGKTKEELEEDIDLLCVYGDGVEETIDKDEWYIKEPDVLKAPSTTIVIVYNGEDLSYNFDVDKVEEKAKPSGFYSDGHISGTLDEIMESYMENHESFANRVGDSLAIGRVDLFKKDNSYGGQLSCSGASNKLTILFSGTDASGNNETQADEVPGKIVALCDDSTQDEDVACICSAFGNLLSTLNPEIDPYDAGEFIWSVLSDGSGTIEGITVRSAVYSGYVMMTVQ